MGMKSAACWFAPKWTVRTSALGDPVARTVRFDIANIVSDDIEELDINEEAEKLQHHFTEVVLEDVFQVPVGRTIAKLKEHLTDIYRVFMREGWLVLRLQRRGTCLRGPEQQRMQSPPTRSVLGLFGELFVVRQKSKPLPRARSMASAGHVTL